MTESLEFSLSMRMGLPEGLQELVKEWTSVLTSIPCCFQLFDEKDWYIRAFNTRQRVSQRHWCLTRSALQLVIEIVAYKVRLASAQQTGRWVGSASALNLSPSYHVSQTLRFV